MSKFLVSYDLRHQRDYANLYKKLKSYKYNRHILESVWVVETNESAEELLNNLKSSYLDRDDGVIVVSYFVIDGSKLLEGF